MVALSVNLYHSRRLLVAGRLWISVLNHAYRQLFFQEQIAQKVQVDSYFNLSYPNTLLGMSSRPIGAAWWMSNPKRAGT
jgi:hypothetical protein